MFYATRHTRSQAPPGNALPGRLCLPNCCRSFTTLIPKRGGASRTLCYQAEPGNKLFIALLIVLSAVGRSSAADAAANRAGIVKGQFINEKAPFPECHASTIVETHDGTIVAAADLPAPPGATIYLRIDARGDRYDFLYSVGADEWTPLFRDADGTILSTEAAGGFVGAMIGMYAWTRTPASEPAVMEGGR